MQEVNPPSALPSRLPSVIFAELTPYELQLLLRMLC